MSDTQTTIDNGAVVKEFVSLFATMNATRLTPYLDPDIVFENYGDREIRGRDQVISMWAGVFSAMERVEFTTLHQAVNGDVVIAEQIHGLALPGRPLAPIRNMAVYRLRDGRIVEWRDYTNAAYARTLM
ncbi:nuclear transport factor 2 family protein [Nonomuraea sp. PA05]|uniref:nuclear transport factor 2 family protein n=1 Tax=Nonomuraea sp. PA05 TaxID=2604466 RepID=UPI0011D5480A|nr:nuclear transport factor 2 family protein [Nonomuraea sp. PA05]TYB54573.1 nuclear transport factor 2 family protein [Nonomuraea sp. PA05]